MLRRYAILLVGFLILLSACHGSKRLQAGQVAPDFRAPDLTGRTIYLNAELTRPVVLTFFATWCVPCRDEVPLLIEQYKRHQAKVTFLCVVVDPENIDKVRAFADGLNVPYPMLLDDGQRIMEAYRVNSLPHTFLIDQNGKIRSIFSAINEKNIETFAAELARLMDDS